MATGNDNVQTVERRKRPRRQSGVRVWADPGGILPVIDCKIIDINDVGAQVSPLNGRFLPEKFILQQESQRILGEAHVIWRNGAVVGIKFAQNAD